MEHRATVLFFFYVFQVWTSHASHKSNQFFGQTNSLKINRRIAQMKVTMKMVTLLNISSTNFTTHRRMPGLGQFLERFSCFICLLALQTLHAKKVNYSVREMILFIYLRYSASGIKWPLHYYQHPASSHIPLLAAPHKQSIAFWIRRI